MSQSYPDDTFLAKWLNGDLSQTELEQSEAGDDLESLKETIDKVDDLILPPFSEADAWAKLEQAKQTKVRRLIPQWAYGAAAAIVILVLSIWFFLPGDDQVLYNTAQAEQKTIQLPDNSNVILNAQTTLAYQLDETSNERQLSLEGEAFFQVEKGNPFIVQTTQGQIEVQGTSFNIWSRKDSLDVSCYSGSVKVTHQNESITLIAGQRTRLRGDGTLSEELIEASQSPSWSTSKNSTFNNVSMQRIFNEIEVLYNVNVTFRSEIGGLYTVGFPQDNLELALDIVARLTDPKLTYEKSGNNITISYKE